MTNYINLTANKKMAITILSIVSCIYLPMLFHFVGIITGTGKLLAEVFSPMHILVIICGLISSPIDGFLAGFAGPFFSSLINGMPKFGVSSLLMSVELSCYGLIAGSIATKNINSLLKVIIIQFSGRIARFLILLYLKYILKITVQPIFSIFICIPMQCPSIAVQLFLMLKVKRRF